MVLEITVLYTVKMHRKHNQRFSTTFGRDVERPEGALNNHRPFGPGRSFATIIGPSGRDVERPEGALNSHRLLDVMSRAPKSRMTIKKTKIFFEIFVFLFSTRQLMIS
jgi:hypothetical protein